MTPRPSGRWQLPKPRCIEKIAIVHGLKYAQCHKEPGHTGSIHHAANRTWHSEGDEGQRIVTDQPCDRQCCYHD